MRFLVPVLLCVAVCLSGVSASASTLYSMNYDTDELVTVDSVTGEIQVVGPLGYDVPDYGAFAQPRVSMTYHNSMLYAMVQHPPSGSLWPYTQELLTIDPATGAMTSAVDIVMPDPRYQLGFFIEGLASFEDELVISCSTSTANNITNHIAPLSVTGEVGTPVGVGGDNDALAVVSGELWGLQDNYAYLLNYPEIGSSKIGKYGFYFGPEHAAYDGNELILLKPTSGLFFRVDPDTLAEIGRHATGQPLAGLAYIPEPSSLILLATAALGLLACGWRKRRS